MFLGNHNNCMGKIQIGASLLPGCKWASVVGLGNLKFWCGCVEEGSICGEGVGRKWEGWRVGEGKSALTKGCWLVLLVVKYRWGCVGVSLVGVVIIG